MAIEVSANLATLTITAKTAEVRIGDETATRSDVVQYKINPLTKNLERDYPTRHITTDTSNHLTLTQSLEVIWADASAAYIEIQLPDASENVGRPYRVSKRDSSANTVTLLPAGTDTINGAASLVLSSQYDSTLVIAGTDGDWGIF